jgi:hypothetical protein
MAGLRHYDVVDRTPETSEYDPSLYYGSTERETAEADAGPRQVERLAPGIYYLYLQPGQ